MVYLLITANEQGILLEEYPIRCFQKVEDATAAMHKEAMDINDIVVKNYFKNPDSFASRPHIEEVFLQYVRINCGGEKFIMVQIEEVELE